MNIHILMRITFTAKGSPELVCPDVGYLGSPAHLTCIPPSNITLHGYVASQGEVAAMCNVLSSSCTTLGNYMASTINQTHSSLTIPTVQQAHAGQWKCTVTPSSALSCYITVVKLPTCFTTSDVNTTTLDVGEELSLAVGIKGYYCSELVQLKISTGRTDHEYPNETVTEITDKTVNININKTNLNFEAELVFTCGGHSSTLPCHATSRTSSTTPDQIITPRTPNAIDIIRVVLVTVPITITIIITIIVTYVCFKSRTIQQKVPPVLECPDPPYIEFKEPLHNTYASVEDLGALGSGSKKDTSPPCTEAYADTGNYAAVGDTSVPDTKTRKDDLPALMDAGGYSFVADRRVADKGTQGVVTAKSVDTGYYETVEDQSAAAPSVMQGDLPLLIDAAGYSTVSVRHAADKGKQGVDKTTGLYVNVEDKSDAEPSLRQEDLPALTDAVGYSTVGLYVNVEDKSDAEPSLRQEDLPALTDAVGYSTVDDFKPCPGAASFSRTGEPESVPNQIEGKSTNRPLHELYATVNKKRGTPRLANADATTTSTMVPRTLISEWTLLLLLLMIYESVELPTCFTTIDVNTTTLDVGEELSLAVHIKGYYCSELVQLKISTGRTDHEYHSETVTYITDKTVNITINKTNSNFEAELVFICGGHSSTLPCHATSRTSSTTLDQNKTPRTPNAIDIFSVVLVTVTVPITIIITIIVTYVCFKRRTIQQKVPPVLECPDPPYIEFKEPLHNTYDSVEDLGALGSGSKKDTSPPCTEAYADTGNYEAVGDTSVPDTKTRKDDLPALMDAGGYSFVADRRVAVKGAQGVVTAKSVDTGYYETVEDQSAAAPSVMQGDLPLLIDAAGYSTVAVRHAADKGKQGVDKTPGLYVNAEDKSDAEPSLRQEDLPALTDAVGYSTVDDFKPCPGAAPFSRTGEPESVPNQIEGQKTNRPLHELYATVNKKRGTTRLANADATTTSVM
ncbi:uncharacterized protein [Haliotis cracherodii]|uniref:uncharacterized protein n=1 Tax=Haliotis cracherodii TaxID=6455 RepID=UPI0039E8C630